MFGSFGVLVFCTVAMPNSIGYQDLASLIARQPSVAERGHQQLRTSSAFAELHAATFSFPRPLGAEIPDAPGYQLASLDPRGLGGELPDSSDPFEHPAEQQYQFPDVDRRLKGDLEIKRNRPAELSEADNALVAAMHDAFAMRGALDAKSGKGLSEPALRAAAARLTDAAMPDENGVAGADAIPQGARIPVIENDRIVTDEEPVDDDFGVTGSPEDSATQTAKLYFGGEGLGPTQGRIEAYAPGEAPIVAPGKLVDPDIKLSALMPPAEGAKQESAAPSETIAAKGEVTGEGRRPKTPAEWLNLKGALRAKQERCLANAIYFEARSEPERGQMAVAQVVMNRVFSPYYPENICGVVYQNAHRRFACQFTFACDRIRDVVTEPEAWETAKRIARDTLDGKIWLPEIGKATHYHATYVRPWWARSMHKYKTLGLHVFYRPKRWGDGSDEPHWTDEESLEDLEDLHAGIGKTATRL